MAIKRPDLRAAGPRKKKDSGDEVAVATVIDTKKKAIASKKSTKSTEVKPKKTAKQSTKKSSVRDIDVPTKKKAPAKEESKVESKAETKVESPNTDSVSTDIDNLFKDIFGE